MTDEYAGDDLTGLGETLGEMYDELAGVEETPGDLLDPAVITDEWTVSRMVTTMVPLLVALSVLQMVSGSVLEQFEDALLTYPALLILVPVQIGTAGNLGSIMCSRLSTELHLGTFELSVTNPGVRANSGAIAGLGLTVYTLVGIGAWAIAQLLGGSLGLLQVMTIALVSGMLLVIFHWIPSPTGETTLQSGDVLIARGPQEGVRLLREQTLS